MKRLTWLLVCVCLSLASGAAFSKPGGVSPHGLNPQATQELKDANVDKYVGEFTPAVSFDVGEGWTRYIACEIGGRRCFAALGDEQAPLDEQASWVLGVDV